MSLRSFAFVRLRWPRVMAIVGFAFLTLGIGGCSVPIYGREYGGRSKITGFETTSLDVQLGQTKDEVRALIGEPLAIQALVEHRCVERWMWFYRHGRPEGFMMRLQGWWMRTQVVDFDAYGRVCF